MRIIIEDESCDILENARLLLDRLREDFMAKYVRLTPKKPAKRQPSPSTVAAAEVSTSPPLVYSSSSRLSARPLSTVGQGAQAGSSHYYSEIIRQLAHKQQTSSLLGKKQLEISANKTTTTTTTMGNCQPTNANEAAKMICDEVIRDSIGGCREADYKMELAKLLSAEAKIELYIELGKLSNAQRLAFNMNRADYVSIIIEEAARLNQNHVKTVSQLWLAKRT